MPEILGSIIGFFSSGDFAVAICLGGLSLIFLGPPIGAVVWGAVITAIRWILAEIFFAPILKTRNTPSAQTNTSARNSTTPAQRSTSTTSHLSQPPNPTPVSMDDTQPIVPVPRSIATETRPSIYDTQPLEPILEPSVKPAIPVLQGEWKFRWFSAHQASDETMDLLIKQIEGKFRGVLFLDGPETIRIKGNILGNAGEFIYWISGSKLSKKPQELMHGEGKFDVLSSERIFGSWELGTGNTLTFEAIRIGDLPGS